MRSDPMARRYAEGVRLTFLGVGIGLSLLWLATL